MNEIFFHQTLVAMKITHFIEQHKTKNVCNMDFCDYFAEKLEQKPHHNLK